MKSFLKNKVSVKQRSLLCSVQRTLMQNLLNQFLQLGGLIRYEILKGKGFPGGTGAKEPACQCRRRKRCRFDPWVGKIPRRQHGNPLQYSCLENPMDREAWQATVQRVSKSQT